MTRVDITCVEGELAHDVVFVIKMILSSDVYQGETQ